MLFRCMHMCNDTCELFSVFVYTPVHSWRVLTEGHGSCTLSVWTLAEPLGVLFQARSDNLAPMTRLATAQFTGRSSTHAQPPPSPTTSLPPVLPWSPICSPCTLIYSPIPLHFPFLSTSFNLSLHAVFFLSFTTPPAFPSLCVPITLLSTESKLHAGILQKQVLQSYQWRQYVFNYYTLISSSRLWKSCWHTANQQLWAQQNSFLMKDKYKGTLIMLKKL